MTLVNTRLIAELRRHRQIHEEHYAKERSIWQRQISIGKALNYVTAIAAAIALCGFGGLLWSIWDARRAVVDGVDTTILHDRLC
jgi:hypothetical protein